MLRINPITLKRLRRFRSIKRGYYSFVILVAMIAVSLGAEMLVSKRALVVCYQDSYYFPTYGDMLPGTTFGLDYQYETDYRKLRDLFREQDRGDWLQIEVLIPIPYSFL